MIIVEEITYTECRYVTIKHLEPVVIRAILNWLYDSHKNKYPSLLFGTAQSREENTLFLLMHGTPEGKLITNKGQVEPEEALRDLISDGLVDPSIVKRVFTISCYGGNQTPAEVDGVEIISAHTSTTEIDIKVFKDSMIIDLVPENNSKRINMFRHSKLVLPVIHFMLKISEYAEKLQRWCEKKNEKVSN
jgi:hypothetical protein